MITDWCFRDQEGQRIKVLEEFIHTPVQGIKTFQPMQLNTLGQAVKDNILYYDPLEGAYGVQGRSLEWGIKSYFDDM